MHIDENYNILLNKILKEGYWYEDHNRKGVKRLETPYYTFRHVFKDGFPAISTKKLYFKSVITELVWFLKGDTNIKYLVDNGCNIWNKDAYKHYVNLCNKQNIKHNSFDVFLDIIHDRIKYSIDIYKPNNYAFGDLGPVYGHQWVNVSKITPVGSGHYTKKTVNQIQELIKNMIEKPMSSELIVNAWNPVDLDEMALPPCHYGFQIIMIPSSIYDLSREDYKAFRKYYVESVDVSSVDVISMAQFYSTCSKYNKPKGFELHWNQRSCDTFLGIPFNIASYATLALILEKVTGHKALAIQGDLKKVHLYDNSVEGAKEQLKRVSTKVEAQFPKQILSDVFEGYSPFEHDYDVFTANLLNVVDDIKLENYDLQPAIKVAMLERS